MTAAETRTDSELLHAFAAGEDAAFVAFVQRHHAAVRRWVEHVIGSRPEVDDVVQETFAAVLRSPTGFRGDGAARAWVFGIARNRIAREFRKRVAEPDTFEPLDELGLRAGWGDPEAAAARAEEAGVIRAALQRLPEHAREVLLLKDVEGFTNPEVSEILGLAVPAVKSRLHRARLALMAELRGKLQETDA